MSANKYYQTEIIYFLTNILLSCYCKAFLWAIQLSDAYCFTDCHVTLFFLLNKKLKLSPVVGTTIIESRMQVVLSIKSETIYLKAIFRRNYGIYKCWAI